jgi:hypothetical protein
MSARRRNRPAPAQRANRLRALQILADADPEPVSSGRGFLPRSIPTSTALALKAEGWAVMAGLTIGHRYTWAITPRGRQELARGRQELARAKVAAR